MDPCARFHPYLSSPISNSTSGAAHRAHTVRSTYPDANKWVQAPLISRCRTAKRWCSGAETESPRIPYARRPVGSGTVVMITSDPVISAEQ
jgi:hypothetical protein